MKKNKRNTSITSDDTAPQQCASDDFRSRGPFTTGTLADMHSLVSDTGTLGTHEHALALAKKMLYFWCRVLPQSQADVGKQHGQRRMFVERFVCLFLAFKQRHGALSELMFASLFLHGIDEF
jgi:hypothetical protein